MSLCLNKKVEAELRSLPGNNVLTMNQKIDGSFIFFSYRYAVIVMKRTHSGHLYLLELSCA